MKRHLLLRHSTLALSLLALTSCHGILDDIYDDAPSDLTFSEGFHEGKDGNHYVLQLIANNYQEWIFIDLHKKEIERIPIPLELTDDNWDGKSGVTYHLVQGTKYTELSSYYADRQTDAEEWDLAIHHFDVKTNGGKVGVATSRDITKAASSRPADDEFKCDVWSDHQVIVDLKEMMGYKIGYQNSYFNPVITQWAVMDFSTPPPTYSSSGDVYILRMADGSEAALQMRTYMSPRGTKGYLTIDIIYPLGNS